MTTPMQLSQPPEPAAIATSQSGSTVPQEPARYSPSRFIVTAPGFSPEVGEMHVKTPPANPPLAFTLRNLTAKDLREQLSAADQLYNGQQWDAAIPAHRAIAAQSPALTVVYLQIAMAYRSKGDFERAIETLEGTPPHSVLQLLFGLTPATTGSLAKQRRRAAAEAEKPAEE